MSGIALERGSTMPGSWTDVVQVDRSQVAVSAKSGGANEKGDTRFVTE